MFSIICSNSSNKLPCEIVTVECRAPWPTSVLKLLRSICQSMQAHWYSVDTIGNKQNEWWCTLLVMLFATCIQSSTRKLATYCISGVFSRFCLQYSKRSRNSKCRLTRECEVCSCYTRFRLEIVLVTMIWMHCAHLGMLIMHPNHIYHLMSESLGLDVLQMTIVSRTVSTRSTPHSCNVIDILFIRSITVSKAQGAGIQPWCGVISINSWISHVRIALKLSLMMK